MTKKTTFPKPRPSLSLAGRSAALRKIGGAASSASMDKSLDPVYQQLRGQGVEPGLARQILRRVKEFSNDGLNITPEELTQVLSRIIFHLGATAMSLESQTHTGRIIAFVGSTGVGKTTTLAKMAMTQAIQHNRKVAIVTTDIHRIAAVEQIKVFTKLLGISLDIAVDQRELRQIIAGHDDKDLIFVDTPGVNALDPEQVDMVGNLICGVPGLEVHLLLAAGTKNEDMDLSIKGFRPLFVKGLVFTKMDETRSYGNILNTLLKSKIPLSAMTTGQRIPEDLAGGRLDDLLERILSHLGEPAPVVQPIQSDHSEQSDRSDRSGLPGQPMPISEKSLGARKQAIPKTPLESPQWVANRNSDVFHHNGCKWALRIKPDHVIMFENFGQALNKGFSPCRSCARDLDDMDVHSGQDKQIPSRKTRYQAV